MDARMNAVDQHWNVGYFQHSAGVLTKCIWTAHHRPACPADRRLSATSAFAWCSFTTENCGYRLYDDGNKLAVQRRSVTRYRHQIDLLTRLTHTEAANIRCRLQKLKAAVPGSYDSRDESSNAQ